MGVDMWLALPSSAVGVMLAEINGRLAASGLSITREDAQMLVERRAEALAEAERVEFGIPAIVEVTAAIADSPCLAQQDVAESLAELQDSFYAIRDELPVDVPDMEIADALRGCLDAWGDAAEVASMPAEEVMRFSAEYMRMAGEDGCSRYHIVDGEGRVYTFDPAEWDYDEQADGWNGERWFDDWDD